jgi:hypothetical protein
MVLSLYNAGLSISHLIGRRRVIVTSVRVDFPGWIFINEVSRATSIPEGLKIKFSIFTELFEIYAFYEERPGRAMDQLDALRRLYPTHPLWALRAAEHLRARLGAYGEAAAAGREILARAAREEENFKGPWVPALARLELGHALLADLRPADARPYLLVVAKGGIPGYAAAAPRARYLLGRSLELEGDRKGAIEHYRIAAEGADSEWRQRAREAAAKPMPDSLVRARAALGEARRHREARRGAKALALSRQALREWPQSMEAALAVVEERLASGDAAGARAAWPRADPEQIAETPWLRGWEWLLEAERHDLEGRRAEAVRQYKKVLQEGLRRPDLETRAQAGINGLSRAPAVGEGLPRTHAIYTPLSTT